MLPRLLLLLLTGSSLAFPGAVGARVELGVQTLDPVVAGDAAVELSDRGDAIVAHPLDGGRPYRAADVPLLEPARRGTRIDRLYDASSTHAAITQFLDTPRDGSFERMLGGPLRGPFRRLDGCGEHVLLPVSVDASLVAAPVERWRFAGPCSADQPAQAPGNGIVVRNLDAERTIRAFVPVENPAAIEQVSLQGSYVLFHVDRAGSPGDVVVWNWQAGREAYRVSAQAPAVAALQADGTAIVGREAAGVPADCAPAEKVTAHTPAEPAGRPLPFRPCTTGARLRDGRLTFTRVAPDEPRLREVVAADLHGNERVLDRVTRGLIDAGAEHALVSDDRCHGRGANAVRLDAAAPAAPPLTCPLRLREPRRVTVDRRGRAAIPIDCPAGCDVILRVRTRRGASTLGVHQGRPGSARVRVQFPRTLLRRGERIAATVVANSRDRDGRARHVRRRVVLVRPGARRP